MVVVLDFAAVTWVEDRLEFATEAMGLSVGVEMDGVVTMPFGELGAAEEGVVWDDRGGGPAIELDDGSLL